MAYCNSWCRSEADQKYHDTEWGVPLHDDRKQFEFLMLEVMQCGLSWRLILKKRAVFQRCFDKFNYEKISRYTGVNIKKILNAPGMIKSERKIKAIIQNANAFLKIRKEFGSFSAFLWDFCGGKTIVYSGHATGKVPAANGLSARLSYELKKRGFAFLGPVTVYSHLQSCGIINDHSKTCPLFAQINKHYPIVKCSRDQEI
ncbi:MAG: DNA-3-methyladenine glycosylase I [Elusimicrobiaceae bacterium]|nr:DNA-3-methyladenine glycosylase I [Elusimicrobiaceae bacterium]